MTHRRRARLWLAPFLFVLVLVVPTLALAEAPAAASADVPARPVAALETREEAENVARPSPRVEATTRAHSVSDLVNRRPKHAPNPAWPSQWRFSVGLFALVGLGILAFAANELRRSFRERSPDRLPALALFVVALGLRLAVPIGPTNWHTHLFGLWDPDVTARFGPGTWVLQAGLWSLFSPSDVVLARAYAVIGALSVPLLYGILRAQKASIAVATTFAMFWALSPVHIRISASFSEHVVTSTLTFLLLLVALRGGAFALGFSALLFAAIGLCRFDAWPQLALVPLWLALVGKGEGERWSARLANALPYLVLWGGTGLYLEANFLSEGGSHPMPRVEEVLEQVFGLRHWFQVDYLSEAHRLPHWFSPVVVWLTMVGLVWMAVKRRALLAAVIGVLLVSFVPMGRAPSELVTARYFLPALAIVLVPAAYGLEWILERTKLPKPWAWRGGVYVAAFALVIPALGHRYTFQDEYVFLRDELSRLEPGCAVVSLPVRHESMPRDIDCCMSPPLSSLDLALPELRLVELDDAETRFEVGGECLVYYEGPICHLDPDDRWKGLWDGTASFFRRRCDAIRANNRLEPLARAEFSKALPDPWTLFVGEPAQGTLYRVRPTSGEEPASDTARRSP